MDWVELIGLVTGILSVPSSLYAISVLRRQYEAKRTSLALPLRASNQGEVLPTSERVLIDFNPENNDRPGTFEHDVMTFIGVYPKPGWNLELRPDNSKIIAQLNDTIVRIASRDILFILSCLLAIWVALGIGVVVAPPESAHTFVHTVSILLGIAVTGIGFGAWAYSSRQKAERHHAARDVARALTDYLDSRGISVAVEFTQAKRNHDLEQRVVPVSATNPESTDPDANVAA